MVSPVVAREKFQHAKKKKKKKKKKKEEKKEEMYGSAENRNRLAGNTHVLGGENITSTDEHVL